MAIVAFPNVDVRGITLVQEPFAIPSESILGKVSVRRFGAPFGGRWRGTITFPAHGVDAESVRQRAETYRFIGDMGDFTTFPPVCRVPLDSLVDTQGVPYFPTPPAPLGDMTVTRQQQRASDGDVVTYLTAAPAGLMKDHYLNVNVNTQPMLVRVREIAGSQIIITPSHVLDSGATFTRATVLNIRLDFTAEPAPMSQANVDDIPVISFQFVEETF